MTTDQNVIVVGAGLAGLTSAYELLRSGYKVLILEAQDHPGGRVKTLRKHFSHGLFAEAGAHYIPDCHKLVLRYAKQFKLTTVPLADKGIRYYLLGMGASTEIKKGDPWGSHIPIALSDQERASGLDGVMAKYIYPAVQSIGDPMAPNWPPPTLQKYDNVSFLKFLTDQGASDGAIDLIRPFCWWGSRDDLDSVSALSVLRQSAIGFEIDKCLYTIKEGMDALPKALAHHLRGKIRYNAPVVAMRQGAHSVTVTYRYSGRKQTVSADRVICAIPFSTLRNIKVTPSFSSDKRLVIEQLSHASVTRVYLQCKKRSWPLTGATYTDLPIQNLIEPTLIQKGQSKILESYISGDQARTISLLQERDRVPFVLGQTQVVYPDIAKSFERGDHVCWDEDEWARGAYSFFRPNEMFKFSLELLAGAEGRVHFSGDHTSSRPGWMQGALESGHRAAREIDPSIPEHVSNV